MLLSTLNISTYTNKIFKNSTKNLFFFKKIDFSLARLCHVKIEKLPKYRFWGIWKTMFPMPQSHKKFFGTTWQAKQEAKKISSPYLKRPRNNRRSKITIFSFLNIEIEGDRKRDRLLLYIYCRPNHIRYNAAEGHNRKVSSQSNSQKE